MFWDNFYTLCKQHGTSPNAVAKIIGVSSGSVTKWKNGAVPSSKYVSAIADYFGISSDSLLDCTESSVDILQLPVYAVPLYENVSAGLGIYADSRIVGYEHIQCRKDEVKQYFAAKVVGDSMYPLIDNGDTIIVKRDADVKSGDIAVILIDGEEAIVKRVIFEQERIRLISSNPDYKDRIITQADADRYRFVGKVVSRVSHF